GSTAAAPAVAPVTATARSSPREPTTTCRLRPLTFLWASYPRASPPSVDGTDWLSMLPALGVGFRPSARRTRSRRASWIRASVPLLRHSSKYPQTVLLGGKSLGKNSHWQPVRRM